MSSKKPSAKLTAAIKDLFSTDDKVVLKALTAIDRWGDESVVTPLLEVYVNADGEIKEKINDMLSSLKISAAEPSLVNALTDDKFVSIRGDVLSFLWHSRFEPVDAIDSVAKAAIDGDFSTALEAFTLVDNMEGPFPDEPLMEAITSLSEYIVANKKNDKVPMLAQMHTLLSQHELNQ